MEMRIPRPGDKYRHFKGNIYEIVIVARDSETLEEKVVYKTLEGDAAYVRSLPMFLSPVDKMKYPDVVQEYRFEYIETAEVVSNHENIDLEQEIPMENASMILEFLDLNTIRDKINYFVRIKDVVTEKFLEIVAQSFDFVERTDSVEERYEALLQYMRTVEKYEKERLR